MTQPRSTNLSDRFAAFPQWCHPGLVFAFVFLAFTPTLFFDFITYDDPEFILAHPHVNTGLTWENFKWALVSPGDGNLWNPLTFLSHQVDVSLFGLDPAGHHAMNVFWHAVAATLLFLICRKRIGSMWWSYFITLLWAIHPQKIQSVAWIAERKGVLSGALVFACLLCFTEWSTRKRKSPALYLMSLLFFVAAALAKPSVLPLPAVLVLLFAIKPNRIISSSLSSLRQLWPFFATAFTIAVLVVHFRNQGTLSEVASNDSIVERIREVVMSFAFYLTRFAFPLPSRLLFTSSSSLLHFAAALLTLSVFVTAASHFGRKNRLILVGALIYTALWLPVSGIIPVSHYFVADRHSYLPQIGLILMLVGGLQILGKHGSNSRSLPIALGVFLLLHTFLLQKDLPIWRNSETLFGHEMKVNPTSSLALIHYGEFFRPHDPAKALGYYQEAHIKAPQEGMPLTKIGLMQLRLKQPKEALKSFTKATEVSRPVAESWTQLLLLQVESKLHTEAEKTVESGIQRFPNNWSLLMNGGNFYLLVKKDPRQALPLFLRAHQLEPQRMESIKACAQCYQLLGDQDSAKTFELRSRDIH